MLKAGDPIAELASRKDRLLEVQVAETQLTEAKTARDASERAGKQKIRAAEAELNQAKANKVSDLAAIDAKLAYLKVQTDAAAKQVSRLKGLRDKGVTVADEDIEKAELLKAQADAEQTATKATRDKTQTTYEETEKSAQAKIDAAKAELEEALARAPIKSSTEKVELAKQMSELTIIKAPVAGTVLKVTGREGQPTGVEPILHRSEADITRMIARNQVFAMGPREDADRRVVEVVVHLDAASTADAARFVGLQVTVSFAK